LGTQKKLLGTLDEKRRLLLLPVSNAQAGCLLWGWVRIYKGLVGGNAKWVLLSSVGGNIETINRYVGTKKTAF